MRQNEEVERSARYQGARSVFQERVPAVKAVQNCGARQC